MWVSRSAIGTQLDRRWEHLRARQPGRQRRLLASLATAGQQTPIVVAAVADHPDRYLVIDGYKRISALEQLGRDTVEAVVWPLAAAAALVLESNAVVLSLYEAQMSALAILRQPRKRSVVQISES